MTDTRGLAPPTMGRGTASRELSTTATAKATTKAERPCPPATSTQPGPTWDEWYSMWQPD